MPIKYFYLTTVLFLMGKGICAQNTISSKKISGNYTGYTYQEIDSKKIACKTYLKIKAHKNLFIRGTSTFYSENDSTQVMIVFNLSGNYDTRLQSLHLLENAILKNPTDDKFLFKEILLSCTREGKSGNIRLQGTWKSEKYPDLFGTIILNRKK